MLAYATPLQKLFTFREYRHTTRLRRILEVANAKSTMESPNKRLKPSPGAFDQMNSGAPLQSTEQPVQHGDFQAPTGPRAFARNLHPGNSIGRGHVKFQQLHQTDRPRSKHALPGLSDWCLVKTKLGRRFVYNAQSQQSLWNTPREIQAAVDEFDRLELGPSERAPSARWAQRELQQMSDQGEAPQVNAAADDEGRAQRRRSESLQREDEEAAMAELARQAEHAEEQDAKEAAAEMGDLKAQKEVEIGYDSESSYEEVEVTDSEGEEEDGPEVAARSAQAPAQDEEPPQDEGPVEFGKDDIAYQLQAMGEDYELDPGEYGNPEDYEGEWEEGAEGLPLTNEDATNLFKDMLDDLHVSPFTPWDNLISDEVHRDSILNDDRYTVLNSMKARKETWDAWTREKIAQVREERAKMEKRDPHIPYLAFLADKAKPSLYWPEFKRKFKREDAMNDRKLGDKDREKLYRDHVSRLKLPESTRRADLQNLLRSMPLSALNASTTTDLLPQALLAHLHFISLPKSTREEMVQQHVARLPPAPEGADAEMDEQQRAEQVRKVAERAKREHAMRERERKVEEDKRKAEKEQRWAVRDLREQERELEAAGRVRGKGVMGYLDGEGNEDMNGE